MEFDVEILGASSPARARLTFRILRRLRALKLRICRIEHLVRLVRILVSSSGRMKTWFQAREGGVASGGWVPHSRGVRGVR